MKLFHCAEILALAVVVAVITAPQWASALTSDQQSNIGKTLSFYESLITSSAADMAAFLTTANAAGTAASTCSLKDACGSNAASLSGYNISFQRSVQSAFDFVQTKEYSLPASTATLQEMCAARNMLSTWQWARDKANAGTVFFQYYAGQTNNFAVYPPMKWDCTATYTPTQQPYYVSGSTGQKDVVILIDVSTSSAAATGVSPTARVAMSVSAAVQLLKGLSFRDYVAVVTYSDFANTSLTPLLMQASQANIALLVANVQKITPVTGSAAAIATALRAANSLIQSSVALGATSGCNQAVVLLSGGFDDTASDDPVAVVTSNAAVTYFSVYVAPTATSATLVPTTALLRLSCAGNGLATTAAGSIAGTSATVAAQNAIAIVNAFYANTVTLGNARWSEYYADGFGQGNITSGAFPVYQSGSFVGVVAMDVPLSALTLSGTVTNDDVNTVLLNAGQCVAVQASDSKTAAAIATLQNGQCLGVDIGVKSTSELTDRTLKPLYVIITVIIALVCTFVPLAVCCRDDGNDGDVILPGLGICVGGVFWIIALSVFWVYIFDDAVINKNFDAVTYTAIRDDPNAYRCCERRNCQCSNYGGSASCSSLLATLTEGTCGGGYRCCNTVCYSCNCYTTSYKCGKSTCSSRRCSTCCYCSRSVSNQRCQVACGTCYTPVITVAYQYKGAAYNAKVVGSCGLNDTACPAAWFAQAPLQQSATGYVNPSQPTEFRLTKSLNVGAAVAVGIFGGLAFGIAVFFCVQLARGRSSSRSIDTTASAPAAVDDDGLHDEGDDAKSNCSKTEVQQGVPVQGDECNAVPWANEPAADPAFQPAPPHVGVGEVLPLGCDNSGQAHPPGHDGRAQHSHAGEPALYPSNSVVDADIQPL